LRVGLALGAGSARGWAHIGVIRALERADVHPDIVAGTSIGALVGAVYASGELDRLEERVLELGIAAARRYGGRGRAEVAPGSAVQA
jgi:NTE family protein